jgi:hypothetical protein
MRVFAERKSRARQRFLNVPTRTAKVFSRNPSKRRLRRETRQIYGVGDASAGDSVVTGGDSVIEAGVAVSVIVAGVEVAVASGVVAAGLAAGSVVSVFCSHAARSVAPARIQIYFVVVIEAYCFNR